MTGNSYNKTLSGQVLLIAVMLMAVLLTVVFSASFVSRTDTQISKLEEENQKTLAAAEAGIEAALKQGTIADLRTLNVPSGFTGSATVSTTASPSFISPLIQKNEQYTFYMSEPATPDNPDFSNLRPNWGAGQLTVCSTSNLFAMSFAFLRINGAINRFVINPPGNAIITNGQEANNSGSCPTGENFANGYRHQFDISQMKSDTALLLFVRLVGSGTGAKVGFSGNGNDLPLQGRIIVSEAKSPTGVSKKVQLFQSYPQIPTEFFVTSF